MRGSLQTGNKKAKQLLRLSGEKYFFLGKCWSHLETTKSEKFFIIIGNTSEFFFSQCLFSPLLRIYHGNISVGRLFDFKRVLHEIHIEVHLVTIISDIFHPPVSELKLNSLPFNVLRSRNTSLV